MEASGQFHASAALPSGKQLLVPIGKEAEWAPEPFWNPIRNQMYLFHTLIFI
jgi:hypothetical protein